MINLITNINGINNDNGNGMNNKVYHQINILKQTNLTFKILTQNVFFCLIYF